MPPPVRPSARSGWTLLELTLAIAVSLLIIGVGAAVFRIPHQSLARLSGPTYRDAEAFRIFREDLSGLAALPNSKLPALVLSPPESAPGAALVLDLVCARRDPAGTAPRTFVLFQISHRFEASTDDPPRQRWTRRSRKIGEDRTEPHEEILTEAIKTVTVDAWNGQCWTNRWTDTPKHRLPPALRVTLQRGESIESLIAPIPAGFIAEPEHASPTSRATYGQGAQRTGSRQTDAPPSPVR